MNSIKNILEFLPLLKSISKIEEGSHEKDFIKYEAETFMIINLVCNFTGYVE